MSLRIKTLLALAVALLASFGAASSASAARNMEIAIQDDSVLVHGLYYNRTKALARARQLKVTRIRANVGWASVLGRQARYRHSPKKPKWDFGRWDALVDEANSKGIAVQLALTGPAPKFATADHRIGPRAPKARYYRQFVKAAAQHFAGRVDRYSIWNEPNYVGWIAPLSKGPKVYRSLYTTGYKTIKQVDPSAQVLIAETSPYAIRRRASSPLSFLRRVTCAKRNWRPSRRCPTILTDGYAHHPYDFDHPPKHRWPGADNVTLSGLPKLTRALTLLARYKLMTTPQGGAPYVYLTEYGYFSSGRRAVSRSRQGKYLVQAFRIAQRNPRVKEMLHFLMVQPTRRLAVFDTSLATRGGKPFPAFKKLEAWSRRVASAGAIATTTRPGSTVTPPSGGGGSPSGPPEGGGGSEEPPPPPPGTSQPPPQCTLGPTGIPICP
jgi:hypothetical protein